MIDALRVASGNVFGVVPLRRSGGKACDVGMEAEQYYILRERYPLFHMYFEYGPGNCALYRTPLTKMFSTSDEETLLAQLKGRKIGDGMKCEQVANDSACASLKLFLEDKIMNKVDDLIEIGVDILACAILLGSFISMWRSHRAKRSEKGGGDDGPKDGGNGSTGGGGSSGSGRPRNLRSIELPRRNVPGGWRRGPALAPIRTPFRPLR